jgi:phosphonopyruvate decarboxylase
MILGTAFADALAGHGYRLVSGVPCSNLGGLITALSADDRFRYVPAANEGAALAVAAGAWLGGRRAAVALQNSGLGNLVNPLASLSLPYAVPTLLIVSMRAYPDPATDEPQHRMMGLRTARILDALDVQHAALRGDPALLDGLLAEADAAVEARRCFAILVERGAVEGVRPGRTGAAAAPGLPSRLEAIEVLAEALTGDEAVVATTGLTSRELASVRDRPANFYMAGSMGHAAAIGLGLALQRPERRVVVLDGDGAVLMHMGTLSTVGSHAPPNLVHVVLDNGAYGSTGDQPTTSSSTDLAMVARACGYRAAWCCADLQQLGATLPRALVEPGPVFVLGRISTAVRELAPRVTVLEGLDTVAARFRDALSPPAALTGHLPQQVGEEER